MATYLDLTGLKTYHQKLGAMWQQIINEMKIYIDTADATKQNKLTAGNGVTIDPTTNVISFSGDATIFVFVETLPNVDEAKADKIYVVPSAKTGEGNLYTEWYVKESGDTKIWEKLGEFKEDIDLADYYKKSEADAMVETKLADYAKSADVYTKTETDSTFVKVDSAITTEQIDTIFKG